MYKRFVRPILFRISCERIHDLTVKALRLAGLVPGGRALLGALYAHRSPRLEKEVFGMRFANPVGLAAGFDKNAECFRQLGALGFGFVEVGTVTPRAQSGNPKPRLFRLPQDRGLVNRMGLNNYGMEAVARNLRKPHRGLIVGVNISKNSLTPNENAPADYLKVFRRLYQWADYFVVNVSCPNVAQMTALQNRQSIADILVQLLEFRRGQNNYRPILLKISPDLTSEQVDDMIEVVVSHSLDGIVATNTAVSREGLTTPAATVARIGNGGMSGAPLTARSLETVRYISDKTQGRIPIIASGGIMTPEDARNMLDAGADLVQVYSGMIYEGPSIVKRICRYLKHVDATTPTMD
ncbi:dihydroorotate dehydrogenase (quinone) [Bacteroidia bacterium]|nr:dihydroorotate dehydrogenase (quinone) [Bacteroidia bacterium]